MVKRKSFVFYASYLEAANTLKPKDRDVLYKAIIEYGISGIEPKLKGAPLTCWLLIKPQLEANNRKYENGKLGGRPSKGSDEGYLHSETNGYHKKKTNGYSETETKPKPNLKDNVKDNANENAQQRPTAPPAAFAPHKGAGGGKTALGSMFSPEERDPEIEEARRKFFESMKRPAWAAADAAPPDAEAKE